MPLTIVRPTLEPKGRRVPLAPRPGTLDGKRVGALWNNRPHGDRMLRAVLEELRTRWEIADTPFFKKTFFNSVARRDLLEEIRARCDVVVIGVGD